MALIPIGPWKWNSTYRVHPLGLKDSTYRVPLLDSKLVRLCYAWYYHIKSPSGPSSALAALGTPQPSFWTLNEVEPRLTYPNLYVEDYLHQTRMNKRGVWDTDIEIYTLAHLLSTPVIVYLTQKSMYKRHSSSHFDVVLSIQ